MLYAVDLFCGAGGMSEGVIQAGFHILFSNDISEDVKSTYINRHEQLGLLQGVHTHYHQGDISELDGNFVWKCIHDLTMFNDGEIAVPKQIDAIFGGPPCQGFSRAGKRNADDPRNLLFKEYLRVIRDLQPRYVVMENVQGFNDTKFYGFVGVTGQKYKSGMTAPEILLKEFHNIGYNVLEPQVLDASDYGTPQKRKRAVFLAYHANEKAPKYPLPIMKEHEKVTVFDAISDLIDNPNIRKNCHTKDSLFQRASKRGRTPIMGGKPIRSKNILNHEFSNHQKIVVERFSLFKEGEDGSNIRKRILKQGIDLTNKPNLIKLCGKRLSLNEQQVVELYKAGVVDENMLDILLTKKTIRTKLNANEPSLTMVTLPDDYITPFENRTFSVREMARIQSFDDSFEFLGKRTTGGPRRKIEVPQYTQVGNAVPPLLAKAVALEIVKAIEQ